MLERPTAEEYAPFYARYVSLVPEEDVMAVLRSQPEELRRIASSVPPDHETHRYAPGKWSIREVVGHLCDADRVFGYRALCISRGERASLPAFDEGEYMAHATFDRRTLAELVKEFSMVREANLEVFRHLDEGGWKRRGVANDTDVTVRAIAYMMVGHVRHHSGVLRSRYGLDRDRKASP